MSKSLDNLEVGDILIDEGREYRKVLGVCGSVIFFDIPYSKDVVFHSVQYLKDNCWEIKVQPKEKPIDKEMIKKVMRDILPEYRRIQLNEGTLKEYYRIGFNDCLYRINQNLKEKYDIDL